MANSYRMREVARALVVVLLVFVFMFIAGSFAL